MSESFGSWNLFVQVEIQIDQNVSNEYFIVMIFFPRLISMQRESDVYDWLIHCRTTNPIVTFYGNIELGKLLMTCCHTTTNSTEIFYKSILDIGFGMIVGKAKFRF